MASEVKPQVVGWQEAGSGRLLESGAVLALVVHRREYAASDVLHALANSDYEVIEPRQDMAIRAAAELRPGLIVVAADPGRAVDLEAIRELASSCDTFVVLLAPNGDHLALGLMAGAHAMVTDDAVQGVLAAQFAAVRRTWAPGNGCVMSGSVSLPVRSSWTRVSMKCGISANRCV